MTFLPIPAIDVLDGRVVRLQQGDYEHVTVYAEDPVPLIAAYVSAGASRIHLVDLGGARDGTIDVGLVTSVASVVPDLQVGGGIRSEVSAQRVIDAGATRVVVGSVAVHEPEVLQRIAEAVGADRVVVAIDVRAGRARGTGWQDDGASYGDVVDRAVDLSVGSLLVTGIDRDGMLTGPDLELVRAVRNLAPRTELIASGGVAALEDLDRASTAGADAAVIGKALLDGRFDAVELFERFPPA